MAKCKLVNHEIATQILDSCDNFLFDCDGVLYNLNEITPNAPYVINKLRELGKRVYFITNNSMITKNMFFKKTSSLGFNTTLDELICTTNLAANYLNDQNFKEKVYLIGTQNFGQELEAAGISYCGLGPDLISSNVSDVVKTSLDPDVKAVVIGFDEHISYVKILKAASYLKNPSCLFIATNADAQYPLPGNLLVFPGTGSIVSAVATASGRNPVILGKPYNYVYEVLQKKANLDPGRTIVIGDRLDTDILLANNCKLKSMAVLTGSTSLEEIRKYMSSNSIADQKLIPDYYLPQIGDILEFLNEK